MSAHKIVIISVSKTLTSALQSVMQQREEGYPIYEATLDQAVSIAQHCIHNGTEVFISRGRTATYLREHLSATVVDIGTSYFSYANAVNELRKEKHDVKIAILGFSDQFHQIASKYNNLWGASVIFRTFQWRGKTDKMLQNEFEAEIQRLKNDGIEAIIGNHLIRKIANSLGLLTAIHYPDTDMIEMALVEAQYIARSLSAYEEKTQTVSAFLNAASEILIKINADGTIAEFNNAAQALFHLNESKPTATIYEIMPGINWDAFRSNPNELHEKIFQYDGQNIVVDIVPIFISTAFSGAVMSAQKVTQIQKLERKLRSTIAQKGLIAKHSFSDIIGESPAFWEAVNRAKRIAQSEGTVLITGDTGTGKEVFAQSIHNYSSRANRPFVAINCAALSPSVLESELFGYVRGAFTGALSEGKTGIFELAHTGTIFLDEIGELPFDIQAKLLRVVQEKEIVRIGDNKVIPIDVRVIAATNRDLQEEVDQHRFRIDLYYRLSVLTLHLPALEQRKEDIPLFMRNFLAQESPEKHIAPDALEFLKSLHWPGNIRQLRNVAERLAVFSDSDTICISDIREVTENSHDALAIQIAGDTADHMRKKITDALVRSGGNRAQAAHLLGISTVTLWRRIKRIEQKDPNFLNAILSNTLHVNHHSLGES